jgi:hypothetical protein
LNNQEAKKKQMNNLYPRGSPDDFTVSYLTIVTDTPPTAAPAAPINNNNSGLTIGETLNVNGSVTIPNTTLTSTSVVTADWHYPVTYLTTNNNDNNAVALGYQTNNIALGSYATTVNGNSCISIGSTTPAPPPKVERLVVVTEKLGDMLSMRRCWLHLHSVFPDLDFAEDSVARCLYIFRLVTKRATNFTSCGVYYEPEYEHITPGIFLVKRKEIVKALFKKELWVRCPGPGDLGFSLLELLQNDTAFQIFSECWNSLPDHEHCRKVLAPLSRDVLNYIFEKFLPVEHLMKIYIIPSGQTYSTIRVAKHYTIEKVKNIIQRDVKDCLSRPRLFMVTKEPERELADELTIADYDIREGYTLVVDY